MGKKENQKEPIKTGNKLVIKDLPYNKKDKFDVLTVAFCNCAELTYSARIEALAEATNLSPRTIYAAGHEMGWKKLMPPKKRESKYETAKRVKEQKEQKAIEKVAESVNIVQQAREVSVATIVAQMKNFVGLGVNTTSTVLRHADEMIRYYFEKLEFLTSVKKVDSFNLEDKYLMRYYETEMERYFKVLGPHINPVSMSSYARSIGMDKVAGDLQDMTGGITTLEAQDMIIQSLKDRFDKALQIEDIEIIGYSEAEKKVQGEIPHIDGRIQAPEPKKEETKEESDFLAE